MKKILHITTHLGGGVGKALSDLLIFEKNNISDIHDLILLEEPENPFYINKVINANVDVTICNNIEIINKKITEYDIVILHWWHHPLMTQFLYNFPKEKIRLIIWVHISGCTYPIAPQNLLEKAHYILFTTPYSYENPFWTNKDKLLQKSDVVYGLGQLESTNIVHEPNKTLTIGYVGTLNYSKLHPNYLNFCKAAINTFPNIKFVLVGSINEELKQDVIKNNLVNNFEFVGYVDNIYMQLSKFDIFAYLLNPYHFGATENALLEAMAYELPVIALNQSVEKHIIKNMETGILVENEEEFVSAIKLLVENNALKEKISKNAGNYIKQTYSFENNVLKLNNIIEKVYKEDKKIFSFNDMGSTPFEWFLSGVGKEKEEFIKFVNDEIKLDSLEPIFKEKSKSSINHFYRYFKDDKFINKLYNFINNNLT